MAPLIFKEIYDEHFRFVWRSLRRLGVREDDVADAVQEVFLIVHRRLHEFEGRSKVTTWLYGICYRIAQERRRIARRLFHHVSDENAIAEHADDNADVARRAERREELDLLETMLDEMSMERRAVFTLFELEGLPSEEIAEMLQIPLGTVYSRLRLAREQFHRSLSRFKAKERFQLALVGGTQ